MVCQLLAKYWKEKYPDFRLGQLLWAIAGRDPFHIEDYDFMVGLAKRAGEELDVSGFPEYWIEPNERCPFYEEDVYEGIVAQIWCENREAVRTLTCPYGEEYECDIPIHLKNLVKVKKNELG